MERPRPSAMMWAGLGAAITAYELLAPDQETLSEYLDPHLERPLKRALITGAIGVTALHLVNALPNHLDPFEQGLSKIRQAYKARGSI